MFQDIFCFLLEAFCATLINTNIIHLMYGPEGKFCFPESPDVSRDKTKRTSFPRDHTLSVLLYI